MESHLIIKINNYIYLGPSSCAIDGSDIFRKLNLDVVINCASHANSKAQVDNAIQPQDNQDDGCYILMLEHISEIASRIHVYLNQNKCIYLHSGSNISQAFAVVIYYLMSYKKLTYDRAYDFLKIIYPDINIDEYSVELQDSGLLL